MTPQRSSEDGTILLPVIILLLVLATAATAMTLQARTSLREAATRRARLTLAYTADAAVRATALALSAATASRAAPPFGLDGTPESCALTNHRRLDLIVQDEGGRIDLNTATPELLLQILPRVGLSSSAAKMLTGAILARRDTGSPAPQSGKPGLRPMRDYSTAPAGFATGDDIDGLPGPQTEQFDRLRPLFTVANGSAGLDPTVAAPAIRAAIPAKELASPAMQAFMTPSNHSDFTITAIVSAGTGLRFERQALLHLDAQAGPFGRFRSWDAPTLLGALPSARVGVFCQRLAEALG